MGRILSMNFRKFMIYGRFILVMAFNTGERIKTVAVKSRESNLNHEQAALGDLEAMHLPLQ